MKKIIIPMAITAIATLSFAEDNAALQAQINELKAQIAELKASQQKVTEKSDSMQREITAVKKHDAMDNIKFSADLRTAYDIVDYKISKAPRSTYTGKDHNGLWTNKLILGMSAQPRDDLVFRGSIAAYKAFGNNMSFPYNPYQTMDWYGTNAPSNSILKVREAYFLYNNGTFAASLGRRPSLDGFLVNHREYNDHPNSPTGHNINMEFDGASFKVNLEEFTSISGLYFKLCLGRGNSRTDAKYPTFTGFMGTLGLQNMMQTSFPYSQNTQFDSPNMDLAGFIAQLYDDGQYKVMLNYFQAWNVMGANFSRVNNGGTDAVAAGQAVMQGGGTQQQAMNAFQRAQMDDVYGVNMTDVGDMTGGALGIQVSGIGDGWSDFLDDTTVFASVAFSKTDPKGSHGTTSSQMMADAQQMMGMNNPSNQTTEMLGSSESEVGTSFYAGVIVPGFLGDDRFGFEYNHGSKYWRSFTYGEDTLVGSKLATRGNAYEAYYNFPLLGKNLTGQLRFTYLDYDYTGSTMFFGSTGAPMTKDEAHANGMDFVDSASEIRLSLRYRY